MTYRGNFRPTAIASALLAFATSVASVPANAEDSRLAWRQYNPDEVVRLEGRAGVQTTITFGSDEHIENLAIGDSNLWQVTPNKRANTVFLKPLHLRARTNLTVITDQRTYFFDLVASGDGPALYALRFRYPAPPKPLAVQAATTVAPAPPPPPVPSEATSQFAWRVQGKGSVLPARIYDDGSSLYLSWRAGSQFPAILTRNATGEEGPTNFAVHGDVVVIAGLPDRLVLRSGKESATISRAAKSETASASASAPVNAKFAQGAK